MLKMAVLLLAGVLVLAATAARPAETEKGGREPKAATRSPMVQVRRKAARLNLHVLNLTTRKTAMTARGSAPWRHMRQR